MLPANFLPIYFKYPLSLRGLELFEEGSALRKTDFRTPLQLSTPPRESVCGIVAGEVQAEVEHLRQIPF